MTFFTYEGQPIYGKPIILSEEKLSKLPCIPEEPRYECLVNILEMKECNDELKFAAYLLLDDKNMAKRYFLKLDKTTRDLYQSSLPLYNLIKNEL